MQRHDFIAMAKKIIEDGYQADKVIGITEMLEWTFSREDALLYTTEGDLPRLGLFRLDGLVDDWKAGKLARKDLDDTIAAMQQILEYWLGCELCAIAEDAYQKEGLESDAEGNGEWAAGTVKQIATYHNLTEIRTEIEAYAKDESAKEKDEDR